LCEVHKVLLHRRVVQAHETACMCVKFIINDDRIPSRQMAESFIKFVKET
jgi:hypothetical protein